MSDALRTDTPLDPTRKDQDMPTTDHILAAGDPDQQRFSDWLAEHRAGALDDQLTAALREVAEQVQLEAKTGSLTLKLSLSEKGGGVIISHEVKTVTPKVKTEAFYYLTDAGLSTRDPRQPTLPGTTQREMADAKLAAAEIEVARLTAKLAAIHQQPTPSEGPTSHD